MQKLMRAGCVAMTVLAGLIVPGCGSDSSAYVKVIHASPGAPNVDVKVGGSFAAQNLAFGSASSAYAKVGAGTKRTTAVYATGQDSKPLLSANQDLLKNQYYTVIALNTPAKLQAQILNDDDTAPNSGNIKIRVVHGSPSAGTVDVYVTAPGVNIDDPKNPVKPVLTGFTFGTVTPYLQVPAGTYEFRVTPTGNPSVVAIDTGSAGVTVPAGAIFTAVALDPNPNTSGSTFSLLLTQDQPVAGVTPVAPAQ
jgi:hypothetical protein